MYTIENFKTENDVATYIAKNVSKHLGYKHIIGNGLNDMSSVISLCFSGEGKQTGYLNLFIMPLNVSEWKVSVIGIMVANDCLAELTDKESARLWKFGTAYKYDSYTMSACDITGVDLDTICSYVDTEATSEMFFVDRSVVAKRKTVSGIIQEWFSTEAFIKTVTPESDEDSKKFAQTHSMRTEVVEYIARLCMDVNRCIKNNVQYAGGGEDLKATVSLLSKYKEVFQMYLCIDEIHAGIFYMVEENGKWVKRLLPDSISDVATLFVRKA